jgi:hypothetical protein
LTSRLFQRIRIPKLRIDGAAGAWATYHARVARFLDLSAPAKATETTERLARLVGTYESRVDGATPGSCEIGLDGGSLYLAGIPGLWLRNRLIPVSENAFRVTSFPCDVTFELDSAGVVCGLSVRGRELLSGKLAGDFVRQSG